MIRGDLALEGGGSRGVAYVGALEVFERAGWKWESVAGTSAGAIVAALIACGLRSRDIFRVLQSTDFGRFKDFCWNPWKRWRGAGLFKGDAFERWLRSVVGDRPMRSAPALSVVTVDLRNREVLVISAESHPDLPVARAVRMSMSIPHVFLRVDWNDRETQRQCIDGGVLLNYPIEVFDVPDEPQWPTIGLLLEEPSIPPAPIRGHASQARALVSMLREHPAAKLSEHNAYRTVRINDAGVDWLKFSLDAQEIETLVENGRVAARVFLDRWDKGGGFRGYVAKYRNGAQVERDRGARRGER